jgi:dihydroorotase
MPSVLIKNERGNVLVDGERVEWNTRATGADAVLDASGLLVTPGWIDHHCHVREPGHEHKETIASASAAALAGGFTQIVAMANGGLVTDTRPVVEYLRRPWLHPVGAVTRGLLGRELADLATLDAIAYSDDGAAIRDPQLMGRALEYASMLGRPIIDHTDCEGEEDSTLARDLELARRTGGRLHAAHVSTARAVELVRRAKADGVRVTAEVTPHHLFFTAEDARRDFDPRFKMNPPLRGREDVEALKAGLLDGTIDAIATDHAPHAREEKEVEWDAAAPGVVGLETAAAVFGLGLPEAVLVRALTSPIFGLKPRGVTIVDPKATWTVDPAAFKSRGRSTPFAGRTVTGRVVHVVADGRVCF